MTTLETYLRCAAPLPSLVSLSPDSRWRAGYLATAAGFSRLGCSLFCHGSHMRQDTQPYLHRGGRQVESGEWTLILRGRITNYNVCLVATSTSPCHHPYPHILHVRFVSPLHRREPKEFFREETCANPAPGLVAVCTMLQRWWLVQAGPGRLLLPDLLPNFPFIIPNLFRGRTTTATS